MQIHVVVFLFHNAYSSWYGLRLNLSIDNCSPECYLGIACCASHVCSIKILTVYFEKYQHMAYAVGAIGSDLAAVSSKLTFMFTLFR